jgi:hypothetical protein
MAILEISAGPLRTQIGFTRMVPGEARDVFQRRGYDCYLLDDEALTKPGHIQTTDSVVLSQTQQAPYQVREDLERFGYLLNHDCRIYVRHAADRGSQEIVLRTLNSLQLPPSGFDKADAKFFAEDWFEGPPAPLFAPYVHILTASDNWDPLANLIASNPAGRPASVDLHIEMRDADRQKIHPSEEHELLLRRAFWNCASVELTEKANGLSGVGTFEAYAHLTGTGNLVGSRWPYRYFVKLGNRVKVAREFNKYRTTALENVPYHLGPRLRMDRCVLGRSQGLIVSDYVSGAEPLRDCVRDGRGIPAIGNLFNLTLLAWRRAATEEERPLQQVLWGLLVREIPRHREPLIRAYGATKSLEELKALFKRTRPSQRILTGVVHGDLHATNVLVRMNDAVIIDLERIHTDRPLLWDAASLESGLFVDGFINDRRHAMDVLASVGSLYTLKAFDRDDHHCQPTNESAWFMDSVRQIRMQARQMERQPLQYAWTLAAVLLNKACNSEDFRAQGESGAPDEIPLTREAARALAYVLAERLLVELATRDGPPAS